MTNPAKARGITCVAPYLNPAAFGAAQGQLLGQTVKRLVNVLKLRGSYHDNAIYMYTLDRKGVTIGERYEV